MYLQISNSPIPYHCNIVLYWTNIKRKLSVWYVLCLIKRFAGYGSSDFCAYHQYEQTGINLYSGNLSFTVNNWNGWTSLGTAGCRYFISSIGYYPISGHIKEENSYTRTENCLMICNCLNIAHNERCILINIGGIYFVILKIYHCNEYACPPSP